MEAWLQGPWRSPLPQQSAAGLRSQLRLGPQQGAKHGQASQQEFIASAALG